MSSSGFAQRTEQAALQATHVYSMPVKSTHHPKILSRLLQLGILPMHEANLSRGQEQTQAPSGSYLAESN